MYIIIWEYQVKAGCIADFEKIYYANGEWAKLFRKGDGFLGTELLHDEERPRYYITVDRWASSQAYEAFLSQWKTEYERLDMQCEDLTEQETLLGKWASILP